MPEFTSKPNTDPGPFDALRPRPERRPEPPTASDPVGSSPEALLSAAQNAQKKAHSALAAADEDREVERLYRFQEIPVSADMRRELLGAKLPLASADQLVDTQPPHKSALSAPAASPAPPVVDRHAPTEPFLTGPSRSSDPDFEQGQPPLADTGRYSTTAPTLLSVRRRRLRNQRLVGLALAAMILAIFSGVAWRRYTRQHDATASTAPTARPQAPRIAGNRPAAPTPKASDEQAADEQAGDPIEAHEVHEPSPVTVLPAPGSTVEENTEISGARSENAQPKAALPDATSSSPHSASPESAGSELTPSGTEAVGAATTKSTTPTAKGSSAASKGTTAPSQRKAFDPEELIF